MQLQAGNESLWIVLEELKIKESSFIARIAANKLKCRQVAIVVGETIHLHNTSRQEFLSNLSWVRHEMAHLEQFKRYGTLNFLLLYLLESIRKGYRNNRYEIEARLAETNEATQRRQNGICVQ
jgi:hypothetical protein